MLSEDVQIIDLGSENWNRLLRLFGELALTITAPGDRGPLLLFYRGAALLRAVDLATLQTVEVDFRGPSRLDVLAVDSGYPEVFALEENAVRRVIGHAQRRIDHRDDYFLQWRLFLEGVRREWGETILTHPKRAKPFRLPPHRVIDSGLRLFMGRETLVLLLVTDRGGIWTSVILGYREGDFWLVSSLETVEMERAPASEETLKEAAERLRSKYGCPVRVIEIDRETLFRITKSSFPFGAFLLAGNSLLIKTYQVPLRWKAAAWAAMLAATIKRCNRNRT